MLLIGGGSGFALAYCWRQACSDSFEDVASGALRPASDKESLVVGGCGGFCDGAEVTQDFGPLMPLLSRRRKSWRVRVRKEQNTWARIVSSR